MATQKDTTPVTFPHRQPHEDWLSDFRSAAHALQPALHRAEYLGDALMEAACEFPIPQPDEVGTLINLADLIRGEVRDLKKIVETMEYNGPARQRESKAAPVTLELLESVAAGNPDMTVMEAWERLQKR